MKFKWLKVSIWEHSCRIWRPECVVAAAGRILTHRSVGNANLGPVSTQKWGWTDRVILLNRTVDFNRAFIVCIRTRETSSTKDLTCGCTVLHSNLVDARTIIGTLAVRASHHLRATWTPSRNFVRFDRRLDTLESVFPARRVWANDVALLKTTDLSGTVVEVSDARFAVGAPDELNLSVFLREGQIH